MYVGAISNELLLLSYIVINSGNEVPVHPILRYPATMEVNLEEAIQRLLYYKKTVKQYMLSQASDIDRVKMLEKMKKKELK